MKFHQVFLFLLFITSCTISPVNFLKWRKKSKPNKTFEIARSQDSQELEEKITKLKNFINDTYANLSKEDPGILKHLGYGLLQCILLDWKHKDPQELNVEKYAEMEIFKHRKTGSTGNSSKPSLNEIILQKTTEFKEKYQDITIPQQPAHELLTQIENLEQTILAHIKHSFERLELQELKRQALEIEKRKQLGLPKTGSVAQISKKFTNQAN